MQTTFPMRAAVAACALLLAGSVGAQERPSTELTLDEALELFHRHSPQLEMARARLNRELGSARQGTAVPNPIVSTTHEDLGSYSESYLLLDQPLSFLWERGPRVERASARMREARARFAADSVRFVGSLKGAFVDARDRRSTVEALQTTSQLLDELVEDAEARVEEGDLAGYDLRRLRWEDARIRRRLALAEVALDEAERNLGALVSESAELDRVMAADLADEGPPEPPADPLTLALDRRPELAAAEASIRALEEDATLVSRSWLSGTAATGGVKTQADGSEGWFVGLQIPLPITDRRGGARASALAGVSEARARRDALVRSVTLEVRRAESRLRSLRMQAELLAAPGADDGETLLDIARVAYDEGEIGIVELLDAAQAWLDARLVRDRIRADAWTAYFELEGAVGGFGPATEGGDDR